MVRLLSLSLFVLALAPFPALAERSALEPLEPMAALERMAANGQWECHCLCADGDEAFALAAMGGKCDGSEAGQGCQFTDNDGNEHSGLLSHCGSVFVID